MTEVYNIIITEHKNLNLPNLYIDDLIINNDWKW